MYIGNGVGVKVGAVIDVKVGVGVSVGETVLVGVLLFPQAVIKAVINKNRVTKTFNVCNFITPTSS
jgi:hypothetical protein